MRALKQFIHQGKIINTHGVRGDIKIEVWCDDINDFLKIKTVYLDSDGKTPLKLVSSRAAGKFVLASPEGVQALEDSLKYKGKDIYVKREDLNIKEGMFLLADLYGVDVKDADNGKKYGIIKDIIFNPANIIYVIETEKGERMIPAVPQFIVSTDPLDAVYVRPIEGMFDED